MNAYQHLPFGGNFPCVVCGGSRIARYTNVKTCGAACRKRLSRAGGDASAAARKFAVTQKGAIGTHARKKSQGKGGRRGRS